jgi:hypothetical protein
LLAVRVRVTSVPARPGGNAIGPHQPVLYDDLDGTDLLFIARAAASTI